MAEGNVYIEGIDPSIPQWSTEATLQQIKNILSKENALTSTVSKQIDNLAKGDANTLNVLRQTMGQQAKNNKATEELKEAVVKGNAQEQASINKQTGLFNSIKSYLRVAVIGAGGPALCFSFKIRFFTLYLDQHYGNRNSQVRTGP